MKLGKHIARLLQYKSVKFDAPTSLRSDVIKKIFWVPYMLLWATVYMWDRMHMYKIWSDKSFNGKKLLLILLLEIIKYYLWIFHMSWAM